MKVDSLNMFSNVAYQCLKENRSERPTMSWIVEKLEKALELQACSKTAGFIRVGTWGRRSGDPQNHWSFELENDHNLVKITIDHGNVIYSLMFTSQSRGVLNSSNKAGGWAGGHTVSEVMFDDDEKIIGINGTIGTRDGYTIISSLSFETTKRIHGPFGKATKTGFSVSWEKGSLVGFYGFAGYYIDGLGVYVKASEEIVKVGTWGKSQPGGPQNYWYLHLDRYHRLKKIAVDRGDLIYALTFTTQYRGLTRTYEKSGGWNGSEVVSEVIIDWNEEINSINGTVALSRGNDPGHIVISSISFVTNKKTHGPFVVVRGTPFTVPWDEGSFAGFYGFAGGNYLDSIGVYLKVAE